MKENTGRFRIVYVLPVVLAALALLMLVGMVPAKRARAAGIIYVDDDSFCFSDCGGSWDDAYPYLQDALAAAGSGDQIWVAAGVYYPDEGGGQTYLDRNAAFVLKNGVALYGGFAGTESDLSQRNVAANPTVLSGDIDWNDRTDDNGVVTETAGIVGENSYHVISSTNVNSSAVLDGFIVTGGQANAASSPNNRGGGMYNRNSSPTLRNLTFSGNLAAESGGGIHNEQGSSPALTNVIFSRNAITKTTSGSGGGIYNNVGSSPALTNVTFFGNSAYHGGGLFNDNRSNSRLVNITFSANTSRFGGGMYNFNSSPTLINVTFSGNSADYASDAGGGIRNVSSTLTLKNVIVANSTFGGECVNNLGGTVSTSSSNNLIEATGSNACGLVNGVNGNIIGQDPKLGPLQDNGGGTLTHALLAGSPAIDAGTNNGCPATDQRGVPRPLGLACDIGAYEFGFQVFLPLVLRNR